LNPRPPNRKTKEIGFLTDVIVSRKWELSGWAF
jgi:hypothetical protein